MRVGNDVKVFDYHGTLLYSYEEPELLLSEWRPRALSEFEIKPLSPRRSAVKPAAPVAATYRHPHWSGGDSAAKPKVFSMILSY